MYMTITRRIYASLAAIMLTSAAASARDINVRGIVTNTKGEPLQGVCIYNVETDQLLASTNEEGKYLVIIDSDGKLAYSILGMEDTEVPVEGRLAIDVVLTASSITLDEVLVKAKGKLKTVAPEPTDIEIKGNYAHIKTRVKVPHRLFNSSTRLIIQPALYNVTANKMWYLKPLVFDGRRYNITQDRMLDFNLNADPLTPYVEVQKHSSHKDDMIFWSDSVYLDNPDQDFHCDMLMAMENYNRVFYRDTTTISRGTVNPMRFFQYSLLGTEVTDTTFYPTPEMQMRDTRGDVMLTFKVNDARLYMDQGNNRAEMNSLLSQLQHIENDPDAALKSFHIYSTSSPEGNYAKNVDLSKRRMQSALELIMDNLSPTTRRYMEVKSDASVEPWESLVTMLRADSLNTEADAVADIITKYPGQMDAQSVRIRKLPFYSSLIPEKYLPRMRKVSYEFLTSQFRYLTDDEIAEVYKTDPKSLSRYEFFRLYRYIANTPAEKEEYLKKALETHPSFLVAATDLAAMKLERGEADYDLLGNYLQPGKKIKKIPDEARLNHIAACLASHHYLEADSLASLLPDTPRFHKAKIYTDVFNGRYEGAMQEVAAESPVNEVVILLALKANDQAWRKASKLGGSAEEEYLKAVAANRVDEYMAAVSHLENALRLKPELIEIAKIDGDLIDLMEEREEEEVQL
ncbi:hypothetical protein [Duncaniella muricolitica]|uniref:hypothetical protein n=1 Tax=Duncaniella muricolitica TaxID=2880704 RepID=UPI00244DBE78|nr:hypothetical protein [Duncaniella muricolitica]